MGGARLHRLLKNSSMPVFCRRLKPTQTENKRLRRWPEGQHYPNYPSQRVFQQALKACSTRILESPNGNC